MHGLLRSKADIAGCDWGLQDPCSHDEYSPAVSLGSDDKVLAVDSIQLPKVATNFYRQIHEDELRLTQFIGNVTRSVPLFRSVFLRTSGIVDARTKKKLYLTVKSPSGSPEQLVVSRDICVGRIPSKGEFVTYTIYRMGGDGLTHEVEIALPPQLSPQEEASIDARINKLSF